MKIVDRYLLKGFLASFIYILCLLCLLFIVIDIFNELDELLKSTVPISILVRYYAYLMPAIMIQTAPIAVLVAVLYKLGGLNKQNELTAFKASGISPVSILTPYLFAGLMISFGVFLLSETVVPNYAVLSASIKQGVINKGKKDLRKRSIENATLVSPHHRIFFAKNFEVEKGIFDELIIIEENPKKSVHTRIISKKSVYEDGLWVLYDAVSYKQNRRQEIVKEPEYFEVLKLNLQEKPEDFLTTAAQPELLSSKQLRGHIEHMQATSRKAVRRLWVDYYYKIAFAFTSLVVIIIGAPLAMKTQRGAALVGLGTSLIVVLCYYGLNSMCLALGKGGHIPPLYSAWIANAIFVLAGIYMIRRYS